MFSLYNYYQDQYSTLHWCLLLTCISLAISSLEYIVVKENFKSGGIFSWEILSSRSFHQRRLKRIDFLFGYNATIFFQYLKLFCCFILPFISNNIVIAFILFILLVTSIIFFYRNVLGHDGSDQMNHIIIISLLFAFTLNEKYAINICIVFISVQSIISYVIAGTAKIISKKWRSGEAVIQIMNTKTYGHPKIAKLLNGLPQWMQLSFSWHIILLEIFFFIVLIAPTPWMFIFLIWGLAFHIYNASVMGLNNFFWTFLATYPCIIYTNGLIAQ